MAFPSRLISGSHLASPLDDSCTSPGNNIDAYLKIVSEKLNFSEQYSSYKHQAQVYRFIKIVLIPALISLVSILAGACPMTLVPMIVLGLLVGSVAASWFLWNHLESQAIQKMMRLWAEEYHLEFSANSLNQSTLQGCDLDSDEEVMACGSYLIQKAESHLVMALGNSSLKTWNLYLEALSKKLKDHSEFHLYFLSFESLLTGPHFHLLWSLKQKFPNQVHFDVLPSSSIDFIQQGQWILCDGCEWMKATCEEAAGDSVLSGNYFYESHGNGLGRKIYASLLTSRITEKVQLIDPDLTLYEAQEELSLLAESYDSWRRLSLLSRAHPPTLWEDAPLLAPLYCKVE